MGDESSGGEAPGEKKPDRERKKKRKFAATTATTPETKYKLYVKPNYKRQFPDNQTTECVVYVESQDNDKIGNRNPIALTKLFTDNVKGIIGVHRVNAHKVGITFKKPTPANTFLKMDSFLGKHKLKAFVPAMLTEAIGVIRYVPKEMSNEEIYKNISCDTEVISVKRFMRKVDGKLVPLGTIAVTFAATTLPQYAYMQMYRYPISMYIPPLLQCYKCLKFNHSARVCRGEQMCSSCSGQHSYKECEVDEITCINCKGNHLAISRDCPIKQKKMEEKKAKYENLNRSFATVKQFQK
ncbi:uncharacterized protein LOC125240433 [Leguminivora glycinivorella]|uniref:uncharacterized protein LOC125240433 n=1 Tax=Leguminivora glycinivorella TaxID=1035111 RepID=UPI002010B4D9|nr:uncharacterized protein LOC125240433 [Leguminivora glycinivorella]